MMQSQVCQSNNAAFDMFERDFFTTLFAIEMGFNVVVFLSFLECTQFLTKFLMSQYSFILAFALWFFNHFMGLTLCNHNATENIFLKTCFRVQCLKNIYEA